MTYSDHGPAPRHPIIATGDQTEINALVQAGHNRRLTDAERLRLAGLTFTTDPNLEAARLVRDRHPDLFPQYRGSEGLETYEQVRAAAVAAGRTVAEPDSALVVHVDRAAAEFQATFTVPTEFVDVDARRRPEFRAAIDQGDFGAAVEVWRRWLAAIPVADAFHVRRHRALTGFGWAEAVHQTRRPTFLVELEAAVGSASSVANGSFLAEGAQRVAAATRRDG